MDEAYIVKKWIRAVQGKFVQIASIIEQFADLETITIEEVIGRLKAHEERVCDQTETDDKKLLLTHQEWVEKMKEKGENSKDYGHYASECKNPRKERSYNNKNNEACQVQDKNDNKSALLLANCSMTEEKEEVFLSKQKVAPKLRLMRDDSSHTNIFYIDNGASNHMTGHRDKFRNLNDSIQCIVRFGDGSEFCIEGKALILLQCKNNKQILLQDVYYIPSLCTNIISLGQLAVKGNKILMLGLFLWIYEKDGKLLMKVN
ncbi:uncharacterized protein LOC111918932 [Lactuca sativa]|uniref:uncharacterized protein LOC111918932 n=1 Tax=Lactuca sativa TaxID=4236 RepID=UPI000CD7FEF7|nr:uncharacterized protein LOC111918932 [Lactuca sativa]